LCYAKLWKNTRRLVNIWLFLLLGLVVKAASFSATIQAWNKASLAGDVTDAMSVSFLSTSKSAGKITAGNTATLTISNLPACTVNAITLYMRSNQSSGAGLVLLTLAQESWLVAQGDFCRWPGISAYSTTALPIAALPYRITVDQNAALTVSMQASTNSIYIDQLVIDYTLTPPSPHVLTLQWLTPQGQWQTHQLTETAPGAGIPLPGIPSQDSTLIHDSHTWYWIGWCRQSFSQQPDVPVYYEPNDWFYLTKDTLLYALYTNSSEQTLTQDTSYTSGEYALAYIVETLPTQKFLAGAWHTGSIAMQDEYLEKDERGQWTWTVTQLDDSYRYWLDFTADSVSVYHPSSQSWIGHTLSSVSSQYSLWAWKKAKNGSIIIYQQLTSTGPDSWRASCLSISYDTYQRVFHGVYQTDSFDSQASYWHLFPTTSVPNPSQILYTTFSPVSSQPVVRTTADPQRKKYLNQQGQIIIQLNNQQFNLLGQPL